MDELFISPVTAPTSIQRLYYRFMKPIKVTKDDRDAERCDELYRQARFPVHKALQHNSIVCEVSKGIAYGISASIVDTARESKERCQPVTHSVQLDHLLAGRGCKDGQCSASLVQVKSEVETGIQYLLRKRETDPYKDFIPRAIYEASQRSQAPSFPI